MAWSSSHAAMVQGQKEGRQSTPTLSSEEIPGASSTGATQGLHARCQPGSAVQGAEAHETIAYPTHFDWLVRLVQHLLNSDCHFSVEEKEESGLTDPLSSGDAAGSSPCPSSTGLAFQHVSRDSPRPHLTTVLGHARARQDSSTSDSRRLNDWPPRMSTSMVFKALKLVPLPRPGQVPRAQQLKTIKIKINVLKTAVCPRAEVTRVTSQVREAAPWCGTILSPAEGPTVPWVGPLAAGNYPRRGPRASLGCYPSGGKAVDRDPALSQVGEMKRDHNLPFGSEDDCEGLQVAVCCSAPSFQWHNTFPGSRRVGNLRC